MPKTLLLADDSVTIRKVVGISFANEDVTLVSVDNGDDAILKAREIRPDAILADVVMPGKNGYEVCEAIKADPDLQHIPVLLLTGTFEAFDEARASAAGAAGHVAKPFEAQTLVDQVKRLLNESAPPVQQAAPVAPPEAITLPKSEDESADNSFDFFDDDLGSMDAPATPDPTDSFEDSDAAFAFGTADPAPAAADPLAMDAPEAPLDFAASFRDAPPPDHTIAILPDEADAAIASAGESAEPFAEAPLPIYDTPAPIEQSAETFDKPAAQTGDTSVSEIADEVTPEPANGLEDSFSPIEPAMPADASFDFVFQSEADSADPVTPEPTVDAAAMNIAAEDLAQATVLDPSAAADYDVSSSDLGDPLAAGPDAGAEAWKTPPPVPEFDPRLAEPVDVPGASTPPPAPAPGVFEPPAAPEPPAADFSAQPEPEAVQIMQQEPIETTLTADSALAEIAPVLRTQLHDTFEKIAWESFGDIGEKIIAQAVERVEKIAWEVIPQLAESFIKEEIRRMKAESDD
jgi:CheY-like chemotaxis protein